MLRTCVTDSTYRPPVMLPLEGADNLMRINAWLETNMAKVVDLFRQWDDSGDALISPKEFNQAMKRLGLKLDAKEVATLFRQFDRDGSGGISYREMRRALSANNTKLSGQGGKAGCTRSRSARKAAKDRATRGGADVGNGGPGGAAGE